MTDFASLKGEVNNWNLESDEKVTLELLIDNCKSFCPNSMPF
jgi:hypothetical protein